MPSRGINPIEFERFTNRGKAPFLWYLSKELTVFVDIPYQTAHQKYNSLQGPSQVKCEMCRFSESTSWSLDVRATDKRHLVLIPQTWWTNPIFDHRLKFMIQFNRKIACLALSLSPPVTIFLWPEHIERHSINWGNQIQISPGVKQLHSCWRDFNLGIWTSLLLWPDHVCPVSKKIHSTKQTICEMTKNIEDLSSQALVVTLYLQAIFQTQQ